MIKKENKEAYILGLANKKTVGEIRKEIQDIYGVKKSWGNEIYKKLFKMDSDVNVIADIAKGTNNDSFKNIKHTSKYNKLEDVLLELQIDTSKWTVASYRVENRKDKDSGDRFQFSISLKPTNVNSQMGKILEDLKADMKTESKKVPAIHKSDLSGKLLEVLIFDLHIGKLAYKGETLQDYDIKIARKVFFDALYELVGQAVKSHKITRIVFPIGNDYLHVDNDNSSTTSLTGVDSDSRFSKIFIEGRKILVEAIDYLKQIAPVDVVTVRGNHDSTAMFHLGDAIECYYHNDKNIKIDNSAQMRKYYVYGQNLILYTHGQNEKPEKLPLLAATEQSENWSKCKWRSARMGHFHHSYVKEYSGFFCHYISSLSGCDKFHFDRGFTGSRRQAQAFVHDADQGLKAILYSTPVE